MTRRALAPLALLGLLALAGCASADPQDFDVSPAEPPAAVETEAPAAPPVAPVEQDPAPEPAAPASNYAPGDPFDETCSVAWPSAPAVTATDIQITAQCSRVPSSYPVVLIVYPDPTLPITPSTTTFRAIGEVYGTGQSQAGMPYLIVLATDVRL